MKIKHNIYLVFIACLLNVSSLYSMQSIVINGLKNTIQWVGNIIGVGLPTLPFIVPTGVAFGYKEYYGNEALMKKMQDITFRDPTSEEEAFLRQYIKNEKLKIRISNKVGSSCNDGQVLYIAEKTIVSPIKLSEALRNNDTKLLQVFAATVEHEFGHIEKKHSLKDTIACFTIPTAVTYTVASAFKKIFPISNNSIKYVLGRSMIKSFGSIPLFYLNAYLYTSVLRKHEYDADSYISKENREASIQELLVLKEMFDAKEKNIQRSAIAKIMSPLTRHPSPEKRIKRHLQQGNK